MKKGIVLILAAYSFVFAVPSFGPASMIKCSSVQIDVGYYGAPCMVDWDDDGLKDLVLGEFSLSKIRFYRNVNSNESPLFTSFSYIKSNGVDITLPYG